MINARIQEVAADKIRVSELEEQNWLESTRLSTEKAAVNQEAAIIKRDRELIENREKQLQLQEDQRRRNRFVSS